MVRESSSGFLCSSRAGARKAPERAGRPLSRPLSSEPWSRPGDIAGAGTAGPGRDRGRWKQRGRPLRKVAGMVSGAGHGREGGSRSSEKTQVQLRKPPTSRAFPGPSLGFPAGQGAAVRGGAGSASLVRTHGSGRVREALGYLKAPPFLRPDDSQDLKRDGDPLDVPSQASLGFFFFFFVWGLTPGALYHAATSPDLSILRQVLAK